MPAALQTRSRHRPGKMRLNSCRSSGDEKRQLEGETGRKSHKSPVFTRGCGAGMHSAQGEKMAFVLPGPPGAARAPSGALCQLRLSLFALFICLPSERAAGGTGNCLDPVAPGVPSHLRPAAARGDGSRSVGRGFGGGFLVLFLPLSSYFKGSGLHPNGRFPRRCRLGQGEGGDRLSWGLKMNKRPKKNKN